MLYLNIKRVMRLRGVENHYKMLLDLGFAPQTARNFLKNAVWRISFEHLERLCLALECTPNDLLEWLPSEKQTNAETQALIKLKRDGEEDIAKMIRSLPIEKFEQIAEILQDLNGKQ